MTSPFLGSVRAVSMETVVTAGMFCVSKGQGNTAAVRALVTCCLLLVNFINGYRRTPDSQSLVTFWFFRAATF